MCRINASVNGRLEKYIQRAGGISSLVWDGAVDNLYFKLETSHPSFEENNEAYGSLEYELNLERFRQSNYYIVDNELLGNFYKVKKGWAIEPFKLLERKHEKASFFDEDNKKLVTLDDPISTVETFLSLISFPLISNKQIKSFIASIFFWKIYHDINVYQDSPIRSPVVTRNEEKVDSDGQNLVCVLHTLYTGNREFKKNVDQAMLVAFGDEYEELIFPPAADQKIQMRVRWASLKREQSLLDISDGTLRFLMLISILASPSPSSLIAIDEPETGLHPSMFPIIADYAAEAAQRTQVVFTTHSPQFLDAFKDIQLTTTVAKWADGQTYLKNLEEEELNYWLKEYTLGNLFKSGELEATDN